MSVIVFLFSGFGLILAFTSGCFPKAWWIGKILFILLSALCIYSATDISFNLRTGHIDNPNCLDKTEIYKVAECFSQKSLNPNPTLVLLNDRNGRELLVRDYLEGREFVSGDYVMAVKREGNEDDYTLMKFRPKVTTFPDKNTTVLQWDK